ncbi:MAG: UvrD-helicase domain-containing protein [Gammaproteobacteria bacterium]|nr:UvrD-helicase domain-containing protein [Gammaproteobacteria bacterium]NNJ78388.1 UvrD-helicase domain-containing protein [Xanthomonadales bacterium]
MTRPADWKARESALQAEASFIVQAPAGSGKTELLTQRMLVLLARVEQPEEVVAITFTRKAAAEMAHRLLEQLNAAARDSDESMLKPHELHSRELARAVLENDRRYGWRLLEQPSRLRVRTIDSLCGELARQLPLLSGLGGGQQLSDHPAELYRQAAVRTLSAIEDSGDELQSDVERVLGRYANQYDRLVGLITHMLGSRDQWLEFLLEASRGGLDRRALEQALACLVGAELAHTRAMMPGWVWQELPRFLFFNKEHEPADGDELRALLDQCEKEGTLDIPTTPDALRHWVTLISRMLTQSGSWLSGLNSKLGFPPQSSASADDKLRFQAYKNDYKALLDRLRPDDALAAQLKRVRYLPEPRYDDEAWAALESLIRILLRAAQEWQVVMAETGGADFIEIASRAIQALDDGGAPSDLALRLDYRIGHLLVDEFQDTSHNQVRLLQQLTAGWSRGDGHSLFLVGDPMQSIYRFRKAEVSLFIQAFEGRLFDQLGLQPLRLSVNFRSTAPVVDWVNAVFPQVMPEESDTITGAVSYSPSDTAPGAPAGGSVELNLTAVRDDVLEAEEVARIIAQRAAGERLAVLLRSRPQARQIVRLLDRLKQNDSRFRYRAIDFNLLGETPLVRDLVSLTMAALQPADRLAWLAVLRGPFVGLDLADLDRLADGRENAVLPDAIEAWLEGGDPVLSKDGEARMQRVAPVLSRTLALRGRRSLRELVEATWVCLGGPACVDNASELTDAARYFELVEALEVEGIPVDRDSLGQRLADLYAEPDAEADGSVQLMTIYAAKGLEFDTVVLPALNRQTRGSDTRLLYWFELADTDQVVMCPMRDEREKRAQGGLVRYISDVESRRQAMETARLLYVAATRAVRQLHLLAAIPPDAGGNVRPLGNTLAAMLWPAIGLEQAPLILQAAENAAEPAGSQAPEPLPQVYRRLPSDTVVPAPPAGLTVAPADSAEPSPYVEYRWAGEAARLTGNLVHRLLQDIAEQGADKWQAAGGFTAAEEWCYRQLRSGGVVGEQAQNIVRQAEQATRQCLASERGRWILENHAESACEAAITALIGEHPVNLVLDRTFVVDGERWIVDYKSGEHAGGDLEGFLESEAERYREQLGRYRRALALSEDRPIRTALYFPLLDRWVEV